MYKPIKNEELRKLLLNNIEAQSNQESIRRIEEYHKRIAEDFQAEWSKKKFRWFLKKRRKKKLRLKICHRYTSPIFCVLEDTINDVMPKTADNFIDNMVDIKDVALGDKAYFKEDG